jgi:DNA-binding transcriptional ArsR family regulator
VAGSYSELREILSFDLPAGEKLLFLVLRIRRGSNDSCWPSQDTLQADTGLTKRSVRNHTISLEQRGLLKIGRRGEDGRQYEYFLNTGNGFPKSAESISSNRRKTLPKKRQISTEIGETISHEERKEESKNEKEEARARARLSKPNGSRGPRYSERDLARMRDDPLGFWASQAALANGGGADL